MESGVSDSSSVDIAKDIVNSSNSLELQLGKNWKNRCISNSIKDIFSAKLIEVIQKDERPILSEYSTEAEKLAIDANEIFQKNKSSYKALVYKDENGKEKIYLEGNVEVDKFYIETPVFSNTKLHGRSILTFGADKTGLITQSGKVFSLDRLLMQESYSADFVFQCSSDIKTKTNMSVSFKNNDSYGGSGVICALPETIKDIGTIFHEVGHTARTEQRQTDKKQVTINSEAHKKFEDIIESKTLLVNTGGELNNYQVRLLKVNEERSAWATGVSIIREVGKIIDLGIASTENIGEIINDSEAALRTYDTVSYNIASQTTKENLVPSFSREMRKAARDLRERIKNSSINYSNLPNFDDTTGESIGSNPKKIISEINKLSNTY